MYLVLCGWGGGGGGGGGVQVGASRVTVFGRCASVLK